MIKGLLEAIRPFQVRGWALDLENPADRLNIELSIDGLLVARTCADVFREDLVKVFHSDGCHGYIANLEERLLEDAYGDLSIDAVSSFGHRVTLPKTARIRRRDSGVSTEISSAAASTVDGFFSVSGSSLRGWAYNTENPTEHLRIEVYLGTDLVGSAVSNIRRKDLVEARIGSGDHAFELNLDVPVQAEHLQIKAITTNGTVGLLKPSTITISPQSFNRNGSAAPADIAVPESVDDEGRRPLSVPGAAGGALSAVSPATLQSSREPQTAEPVGTAAPLTTRADRASSEETRRAQIALLSASGLFLPKWYVASYADLASLSVDPCTHYYDHGSSEGRSPNPYFDARWYLNRYPDVAEAGLLPLVHYVMHGDAEGRQPSLIFNSAWYRKQYEVPDEQLTLTHYLRNCRLGIVSPIPEFDIKFYATHHPDVIAAGVDPFNHYITTGYREGRAPSDAFDGRWYAQRYLNGDFSRNPFLHWLENCDEPGVYGRMPAHETSIPREVKRFTQASSEFEEFRPLPASAPRQAKVMAFYLPQFHTFPENDTWWGKGFTEWTNLARGVPRFKGHYQPRVPRDLGFYELSEQDGNETMRRQARMAHDAGIFGFIFYYYWFNGKRLMHRPLERLLKDCSIKLPFALMWANENWTRRWDGAESEVLISQDYRPEDDTEMLTDFVRHFKDGRYIRIGGRPLLMIYRPGIIPGGKATIARWRTICREEFNEEPIILMTQSFGDTDPTRFGLDGAVEFPPHKLCQDLRPINNQLDVLDPEFEGQVYSYDTIVKLSLEEAIPTFPLIKTAVPSWDNDARRQGTGLVITGSTPMKYQAWLAALVARARKSPVFNESIVLINAWNEWCEGAYLEPDLHFGAAYLNATGRAVVGLASAKASPFGLLLVGHDAFPAGSQLLLLNIGTFLRRRYGMRVEFLLLDGGKLEDVYRALAPTKVLTAGAGLGSAVSDYASRGFTRALLNTSVTGCAAPSLDEHGIVPEIMLVHELPRILREKHLVSNIRDGFRHARNVVFPARFVQREVTELVGQAAAGETLILPQGSYKTLLPSDEDTEKFRTKLGITVKDTVVLGVGYADMRKGFDLFLQVWRLVNRKRRVHFCWVGELAPELGAWIAEEVSAAKATGSFHLPGTLDDIAPAYAASKVLLVTSREDPFPTVALEALSLGKPVIAFEASGGIPELLLTTETGFVVPYADAGAMAEVIDKLIADPEPNLNADARRSLIRDHYSFSTYVSRLVSIALPEMQTISVVVPNYNYARYIPERLASIFGQTHPLHETIVLDDASSDESLALIPRVAADWGREIQLVANKVNSGSVFDQWRKAAELATGDWLWIAEADDSSDPDFLARLMTAVGKDSSVVMAFSDSRTVNTDGSRQWDSYKSYYATVEKNALTRTEIFDGDAFVSRFLSIKNLILNVSAVVWRREALMRALDVCRTRLSDYKLAGDWLLYLETMSMPGARIAYEAEALNVHRRHEQSVTRALDVERHVAEIKRCHDFARDKIHVLSNKCTEAQKAYVTEVARQLGVIRPTTAPDNESGP